MASIKLYDQNMNLETLQNWMDELNATRTEEGTHQQYKVTIPVLISWDCEEFLIDETYQDMVMNWVFDKINYHKTVPFIIYHALPFDKRNKIREYYLNRMREDGIDVEWDIIRSAEDLETWVNTEAPTELYPLWNKNWREHYATVGIKDTIGIDLDPEYDPTIRQLLLQIDMI